MSTVTIVIIVVAVIVIAAWRAAGWRRRRRRLQDRFGPEYDRVAGEQDSKLKADAELAGRERRVQGLDIRPLTSSARARYADQWDGIQEQFVDASGAGRGSIASARGRRHGRAGLPDRPSRPGPGRPVGRAREHPGQLPGS